jgi:hypothetical protein
MDLPIACTLTEAGLRERRQSIMDMLRKMQVTVTGLPDGYAFALPMTSEALLQVTQLVDMERQCCPFLTFTIVIEAAQGGMRLEVTGPGEAKKLIAEFFVNN